MSLEAENERLRAELAAVTEQRNSAHRKAKFYFRKWKRLSQLRDKSPSALDMVRTQLESELKSCRGAVACYSSPGHYVDYCQAQATMLEAVLAAIPKCIERATTPPKPPKPPKRRDPAEAMEEWLAGQVKSCKESYGDVGWFTEDEHWGAELRAKQEAYENALSELQYMRKR